MEFKQVSWESSHNHNKPEDGTAIRHVRCLPFHLYFDGTSYDMHWNRYTGVNASLFREVLNV